MRLKGIPVSGGCAFGRAVVLYKFCWCLPDEPRMSENTKVELLNLQNCINILSQNYCHTAEKLFEAGKSQQAELLLSHDEILHDCMFEDEIKSCVKKGFTAAEAARSVTENKAEVFALSENSYLRERVSDLRDIAQQLIQLLRGEKLLNIKEIDFDAVLVAEEIPTSLMASLDNSHIKAIATSKGSSTSHTGILAKSMGIPAVMGCSVIDCIAEGQEVCVDGTNGIVYAEFTCEERKELENRAAREEVQRDRLMQYKDKKTQTADLRPLKLYANLMDVGLIDSALNCGAEGVGLFRTEMLFWDRTTPPSENEQYKIYRNVLEKFKDKPVIIRTVDIGGDKICPYIEMEHEENPFLGIRGLRLSLLNEELFRTQLRAILRAAVCGNAMVMFPMVSDISELNRAKQILDQEKQNLRQSGEPFSADIPVGIMIEVPSVAAMADIFAKQTDFASIGSNDLTQYVMAADRHNNRTTQLCTTYHPAVLRMLKYIIDCYAAEGKLCGMCGEAAADPLLVPLLVGMGLTEFSVNINTLLGTRKTISKTDFAQAAELVKRVLNMESAQQVREVLTEFSRKSNIMEENL